jgi:hypothetical protein
LQPITKLLSILEFSGLIVILEIVTMNLFGNDFAADFLDFIGGRTSNKSSEKDHVLRKNL